MGKALVLKASCPSWHIWHFFFLRWKQKRGNHKAGGFHLPWGHGDQSVISR